VPLQNTAPAITGTAQTVIINPVTLKTNVTSESQAHPKARNGLANSLTQKSNHGGAVQKL